MALSSSAQDGPQAPLIFSAHSDLVVLHVTVRDRADRYIGGLSKDAFIVYDNGKPQEVSFFLDQDAPATIGLLLDNSGSMGSNRELVVAAATAFARTSNPRDDLFALPFDDVVRSALPTDEPFTRDPDTLRTALERAISPRGQTSLYDAVAEGIDYVERGNTQRKVLVIVSDGADTASLTRYEELLPRLQASNIVVYVVGLADPITQRADVRHLKEFADATGGHVFTPRDVRRVDSALQWIAEDIRHAYIVAYEPSEQGHGAEFRRIRVSVQTPNRQSAVVHTRAGYIAASAPAGEQR